MDHIPSNGEHKDVLEGPAKKRARLDGPPSLTLSSDLWSLVLVHLPYRDILSCTTINRTFLREVAPQISSLHISSSSQLHAVPSRRFSSGTRRITIDCLFSVVSHDDHIEFHRDVVGRIVPFLSVFPNLERASIGGTLSHAGSTYYMEYGDRVTQSRPVLENERLMRSLLLSICGAYRAGTIPSTARVEGVLLGTGCNNTDRYDGRPDATWGRCHQCHDICASFPLRHVASFDTVGDGVERRLSRPIRDRYRQHVCLTTVQLLGVLMKRRGGKALLMENTPFFLEQVLKRRRMDYLAALKHLNIMSKVRMSRTEVKEYLDTQWCSGERNLAYGDGSHPIIEELMDLGVPIEQGDFAGIAS